MISFWIKSSHTKHSCSGLRLGLNFQRLNGIDCILFREFERMLAETEESRKETSIGNDVPTKGEGDIFVSAETVAVVPEIIFRVHVLEIENCILSAKNYLVPENNLKEKKNFRAVE